MTTANQKSCTGGFSALMNKKVGVSFEKASEGGEKGGFESRISRRIKFSSPPWCGTPLPWHKGNTGAGFFSFLFLFLKELFHLFGYIELAVHFSSFKYISGGRRMHTGTTSHTHHFPTLLLHRGLVRSPHYAAHYF